MSSYPLIRNRWSNEHLLAVLFFVLSLYQLADWTGSSLAILRYLLIVAVALFLDAAINYIRYAKPVCAVSAAVTAAVLYPVIKGLPGWAGLLGIAVSLIVGKHIWGGTGKNIFNPAVTAMFVLSLIFQPGLPRFEQSYLLLPAMLLSLPFILVRPFPGIGLMAGMLAALFLSGTLDVGSLITYGVIYWSCLVITDPATATGNPSAGLLMGFAAGFMALYFNPSLLAMSAALLAFNGISHVIRRYTGRAIGFSLPGLRIKAPLAPLKAGKEMLDLTESPPCKEENAEGLKAESILERIGSNEVFGMGGAGFPTLGKLETVIKSGAKEKYLIINGMECDPGLIHDKWLIRNRQDDIAKGIGVLGRIVEFKSIYYIAKDIKGVNLPEPVQLQQLPDKYPYGAERIFVKKLLGISIPIDSNPAQYGVLVMNVQTVLAAYEAVCCNRKADTRYITVADMFTGKSCIARVRISDRIRYIVDRTVGSKGITFAGGGIMQASPAEDDRLIGRNVNFIAVGMLPKYKESVQCINCGLCRLYCPMGLNVGRIAELLDNGKVLEAQTYNSGKCLHCGTCSYVCLAGKNLSGRMAKQK